MTQPNPFSLADSYTHLISPKIIGDGITGYDIAVDLVDIDTIYSRQLGGPTSSQQIQQAYIRQIGSTGLSGQAFFNTIGSSSSRGDAYFNNINWTSFTPPLPLGSGSGTTFLAGPGISIGPQTINGQTLSANFQGLQGIQVTTPSSGPITIGYNAPSFTGSTGINVSFVGNTYTLTSTIGITGSTFIGVQQTGSTYTISYLGSQGGTATPITGVSGAYAVFGSTGLQSSTVLNSSNIVGPTGNVMLYSSQGPTSSSLLNLTGRTLNSPTIVVHDSEAYPNNSGKYLRLTADTTGSFLQSGNTEISNSSAPLNITGYYGGPVLTRFDLPTGLVTINPGNSYPSGVTLLAQSSVSQNIFYPSPSSTYNVYMWGGGGAGLSGFPGGAGGYVKLSNLVSSIGGITFGFINRANSGGGGNALELQIGIGTSIIQAAVAPGGGAGGTGGTGAAYGEPGGSYPGQGFSAGVTGGTGGIFTNFQTNGTTGFVYRIGTTGVTAQSGIFNNVQVTYGLTGFLSAGTKILGYGAIPNVQGTTFSTYYFPPGSTLVFQTNGITFENSLYSLSGITNGILDLALPLSSLTGATLSRQASGGTFTIDSSFVNQQFQNGYVGGTFIGDGSGIDQMLIGATFSTGLTGLTLTVNYGTTFTDFGISGGIEINFLGGLTFNFSRSLGSVLSPSVRITDPIFVVPNSIIQVQYQNTILRGQTGTQIFTPTGAGGGFYNGGGGIQGGGGGAGSALINPSFTGVTGAGSGTSPFPDTYNLAGQYGFGGSGSLGGTPYYIIELVSPGTQPNVLQVNGNETVSGGLKINGYLPNSGNDSINVSNDITARNTLISQSLLITSIPNGTNQGGQILAFENGLSSQSVNFPYGLFVNTAGPTARTNPNAQLFQDGSFNTKGALRVGVGAAGVAGEISATGNITTNGALRVGVGAVAAAGEITATGNITTNGALRVGVGAVAAAGEITATGNIKGLDLIATSDRRLKENIQTIDSALEKVMKLRGVYFNKKDSEKRSVGVIAQEIEEILPEVVHTDDTPEEMKSVSYGSIVALLIEAIKEQQEQIKKFTVLLEQ
jgi:hypothetical protein